MCISKAAIVVLQAILDLTTALYNYGIRVKDLLMSWKKFIFLAELMVFLDWVCTAHIAK